jgi:hypothetical protein
MHGMWNYYRCCSAGRRGGGSAGAARPRPGASECGNVHVMYARVQLLVTPQRVITVLVMLEPR